ncbi:MAG TPA: ATP-binding protein [Bacteroidota bacterium]|nr:ATP-binding protein [Bacteroidota bacterium]
MDLRNDTTFFGRTDELYQLVKNLQRGRHTLVLGPKGIGKSRLMMEAKAILEGRTKRIDFSANVIAQLTGQLGVRIRPDQYKILYIEHSAPLGDCLNEICEKLYQNRDLKVEPAVEPDAGWLTVKKQLRGLGNMKLQDLVLESLSRSSKPYLLFFDSLDRISPSHQQFIERLFTVSVVCAAIVQIKEAYHFRKIWSSFNQIELEPLDETTCSQLIYHFTENYPIHVIDVELYKREVLKSANGNPFHIKNMIWHSSREKYVSTEEIRKLRQTEQGDYFNMGPIYIFGVSIFTLFKIFSLGTSNREFYIYFSALGFMAYLVFRVFRAFFLFRPQKYR